MTPVERNANANAALQAALEEVHQYKSLNRLQADLIREAKAETAGTSAILYSALEDLARARKERDGLAAALAESKKHAKTAKVSALQVASSPHTTIAESDKFDDLVLALEKWSTGINVEAILAAHDRAVAARVLRDVCRFSRWDSEILMLKQTADAYESGEREVPNA